MEYTKEPFNFKLFVLKMLGKWYQFVACTLVGAVLFGGTYYLYKVVYAPAREYEANATYYIEYAVDPRLNDACTYFNEYTLNSWVLEDVFLKQVMPMLSREVTAEALDKYLEVTLPSDVRVMKLTVVTPDPVLTMELLKAYDTAFQTFATTQKEIGEIRLQGISSEAIQIKADIRTQRAFVLGGVLGLLIGGLVIILKYLLDDSIYLPLDLGKRHGLKVFGADVSEELAENIRYAVKEKNRVAITGIYDSSKLSEILEKLKQISPDTQWVLTESVLQESTQKTGEMLRECDGCVLAVMSGKDKSSAIDRALSYYTQQDITVLGAILYDADEKLLKRYDR